MVSPNGLVRWSIRNLQSVSVRDKFTYELRTDLSPEVTKKLGISDVAWTEVTIAASCVDKTAQVKSDKSFNSTGEVIKTESLDNKVVKVPEDSVNGIVLSSICGAARKHILSV